jgi:hypothetical protein
MVLVNDYCRYEWRSRRDRTTDCMFGIDDGYMGWILEKLFDSLNAQSLCN